MSYRREDQGLGWNTSVLRVDGERQQGSRRQDGKLVEFAVHVEQGSPAQDA